MTMGSGDRAGAAVSTAARKSRRTLFGTKIEQLFAEYRVSLGQILDLRVSRIRRRPTAGVCTLAARIRNKRTADEP